MYLGARSQPYVYQDDAAVAVYLEKVVVLVGPPVDHLVEVGEVPVQVHVIGVVSTN